MAHYKQGWIVVVPLELIDLRCPLALVVLPSAESKNVKSLSMYF